MSRTQSSGERSDATVSISNCRKLGSRRETVAGLSQYALILSARRFSDSMQPIRRSKGGVHAAVVRRITYPIQKQIRTVDVLGIFPEDAQRRNPWLAEYPARPRCVRHCGPATVGRLRAPAPHL